MTDLHAPVEALVLTRTYHAPRERVFAAWTDPARMTRWFGPGGDVEVTDVQLDPRESGTYRIVMLRPDGDRYVATGTYREVREPERLVFTWTWEDDEVWNASPPSLVTVDLHDAGDGSTQLTLTHALLPNVDSRGRHEHGWNASLDRLAAIF